MSKELFIQLLKGKLEAKDKYYPYSLTPDGDEFDDAVYEARDHGIPIASFGDTKDKMVFHPGHLGYTFKYYWGNESWGDNSCWDDETPEEKINEVNKSLFAIVPYFNHHEVKLCDVGGSCKGYLSTNVYDSDEFRTFEAFSENSNSGHQPPNLVLFVYGITSEQIKIILNNLLETS